MLISQGIDLLNVKRINNVYKRYGQRFLDKVFSCNELEIFKKRNKLNFLANRFAAKEAILKAFGFGWRNGVKLNEIEILNDHFGKPEVFLKGKTKEILHNSCNLKIIKINISISDEKDYVMASALLIQE
tara:strand:- start:1587 stop:1973 length:387 start_codon:yes stop_codon:yes gene_type:complete